MHDISFSTVTMHDALYYKAEAVKPKTKWFYYQSWKHTHTILENILHLAHWKIPNHVKTTGDISSLSVCLQVLFPWYWILVQSLEQNLLAHLPSEYSPFSLLLTAFVSPTTPRFSVLYARPPPTLSLIKVLLFLCLTFIRSCKTFCVFLWCPRMDRRGRGQLITSL